VPRFPRTAAKPRHGSNVPYAHRLWSYIWTMRSADYPINGTMGRMKRFLFLPLLLTAALPLAAQIKVGLIGLDTSHVIAFTRILNDPQNPNHVPGAKVVAGYRGGSPDLPSSRDRIDKFTAQLHDDFGVEIVDDIPTLCSKVDVILLESVDGRKHLEQVKPVFEAGKPVFIDKPLAATLKDALEIERLGKQHGVPWFSASSLRYSPIVEQVQAAKMTGAITWGPSPLEASHPLDLSWYGIHAVELLYGVMGPGCVRVSRTFTDDADVIVGVWKDGRTGVVRTIRNSEAGYGAISFGADKIRISEDEGAAYAKLVEKIVEFFQTRKPPVPNAETLEIFRFMDAALRSKQNGGAPVTMP
jgi:Oxidoreductase family, NAD-binding Rossmann fold